MDFIVMEYVAGKTLDQLISRNGMPLTEVLRCSIQIARALARAHAAGAPISPDGRWVSFVGTPAVTRRQIFVVPLTGKLPVPQSEWIPITGGQGLDRESRWAPDGKLLYFLSERDGFRCFWAQPLDPATRRPAGVPFAVQHFHRTQTTGNIWMVQ